MIDFIFGTGNLHHLINTKQRKKLLKEAIESGFNSFDTAPAYGNGINELELGICTKKFRNKFEINTKFGIPVPIYNSFASYVFPLFRTYDYLLRKSFNAYHNRDFSISCFEVSLKDSLKRLQTDYIDIFFLHEPINNLSSGLLTQLTDLAEKYKAEGIIKKWGIAGPFNSLKYCESLEYFDVIQTDVNGYDSIANYKDKEIILFGIYRSYSQTANNLDISFIQYIKELKNKYKCRFILNTTDIKKLEQFRELFSNG